MLTLLATLFSIIAIAALVAVFSPLPKLYHTYRRASELILQPQLQ